ncbi:MAG: FtsX-like permease family protein [Chloroflexota bacterium]
MNLQLTLAWRYLAGRKLRAFLTTLAVVFGVLVIFGMNIVLPTMIVALQVNMQGAAGLVDFSATHATGESFLVGVASRLVGVDGVRAVSPTLDRTLNLPADFVDHDPARADAIAALALIGVKPEAARSVRSYPVVDGRYLEPSDMASAVISQTLADALGVGVGDSFSLPSVNGLTDLTVVGILPPRAAPGNEEVLVNLPQAQLMTGEIGRINMIDINVETGADEARRAQIVRNIEGALGSDYQVGTVLSGTEMFASLRLGQAAFNLFGVLALFMGGFIIFNTFRTIVAERRRDIGMLRALGASRRTIVGTILAEGLLQGMIGTALGLAFGYLMGAGILRLAGPMLSSYINIELGEPVVTPALVILSILLGVGITVLAGLLPARSAAKVTPLEALRPTLAEAEFRRQASVGSLIGAGIIGLTGLALFTGNSSLIVPGGFLFLIGLVLIAPLLVLPIASVFGRLVELIYARQGIGGLAQGNLTRQPSRVALTASATMLGLAVIVAAGGLISSLTGPLYDVMHKSLGSDYLFVPPSVALWKSNVGAGPDFAQRLRALDGVGGVSTLRFAGSRVNGQAVSLMGIDPVEFPRVSGLRFQQGDALAYQALADGHSLIANGAFMATTGAQVGGAVELLTPNGPVEYRVAAIATDLLNVKVTTAFVSQANMATDFGTTEDVFVQLNLRPGADRTAADAAIRAVAADYPQFKIISGQAYFDSMKAQMDAAFAGMYFMLAFLAVPSLIAMLNTLTIAVIERTREIGMLRAVGAIRKQVRSLVLAEALLLAAIGTALGLLGGLYLGYTFVRALDFILPLGYSFPLTGFLAAAAVGLLFGALAAFIPARQAARMDVVAALHYE